MIESTTARPLHTAEDAAQTVSVGEAGRGGPVHPRSGSASRAHGPARLPQRGGGTRVHGATSGIRPAAERLARALREHWPEYLIEAAGLGLFMVSAGAFGTLLEFPGSPLRQAIADPFTRRAMMGLAMGLTAIALIYSPWGKQSGAHFNPAVTLTFLRLGKVNPMDAAGYVLAQFVGGTIGVLLIRALLGSAFTAQPVLYVMTLPGPWGEGVALLAEVFVTFAMMMTVLLVSNTERLARYTGLFAGCLVATYITFEAPISGMSLNPARSFASAAPAGTWNQLWIYFVAPPLGMLAAAQVYLGWKGPRSVSCAKLHHQNDKRCIFCLWQHGKSQTAPTETGIRVRSGVIV